METKKALDGIKILVACSAKKMSVLANGLQELGACVLPFPVIEIKGVEDRNALDRALAHIERYDWIIFTSMHGVIHFFQGHNKIEIPGTPKFCTVGPATANVLRKYGFEPDLVPDRFVAEGIIEALERYSGGLQNLAGCRILLPRAKAARDVLPKVLESKGAHVDILVCYQTVRAELSDDDIRNMRSSSPDLMVFTSSSTVVHTMETLGFTEENRMLSKSAVAAIGPITAATLESFGKKAEIVPKESTIASLIHAIKMYYRS